DSQAGSDAGEQPPAEVQAAATHGLIGGEDSKRHPEAQQAVQDQQAANTDKSRCHAEKQGSPKGGSFAKNSSAKYVSQKDTAVNRQRGYQASRPVVHAEQAITETDQPIQQR